MMNIERSTKIFHILMAIIYIILGIMFLKYENNPLNIGSPFNYILGTVFILYGGFRGVRSLMTKV